ncbi:MAG: hypothetical protein R6W93_12675 [Candidatus Limnocylindrales bacterium]
MADFVLALADPFAGSQDEPEDEALEEPQDGHAGDPREGRRHDRPAPAAAGWW